MGRQDRLLHTLYKLFIEHYIQVLFIFPLSAAGWLTGLADVFGVAAVSLARELLPNAGDSECQIISSSQRGHMHTTVTITPTHEPRNFVIRKDPEDAHKFGNFHKG